MKNKTAVKKGRKMVAHTPGPWRILSDGGTGLGIASQEVMVVLALANPSTYRNDQKFLEGVEETRANATLIAAAPFMLYALRYAIERNPGLMGSVVDAAIRLARGEPISCSGTDRHCDSCDDCHAEGGCQYGR